MLSSVKNAVESVRRGRRRLLKFRRLVQPGDLKEQRFELAAVADQDEPEFARPLLRLRGERPIHGRQVVGESGFFEPDGSQRDSGPLTNRLPGLRLVSHAFAREVSNRLRPQAREQSRARRLRPRIGWEQVVQAVESGKGKGGRRFAIGTVIGAGTWRCGWDVVGDG